MVRAAHELAAKNPRFLIRAKNVLWNPLRLNQKALADLNPYIVMNAHEFDAQLLEWNRKGGTLIYHRSYRSSEDIAAHHAQMIVECPIDEVWFEKYLDGAHEVGVVHHPPHWKEHLKYLLDVHPIAERAQAFHEFISKSPQRIDIENLLGKRGFTVCSDEEAAQGLGLSTAQVRYARNAIYRRRQVKMVSQVVTRIEPGTDIALQNIYRYIEEQFTPNEHGVRFIVGEELRKATRWWRAALSHLERLGSIKWMDTLYCYTPDLLPPKWYKIQAEHDRARRAFDAMMERVERMPEI